MHRALPNLFQCVMTLCRSYLTTQSHCTPINSIASEELKKHGLTRAEVEQVNCSNAECDRQFSIAEEIVPSSEHPCLKPSVMFFRRSVIGATIITLNSIPKLPGKGQRQPH